MNVVNGIVLKKECKQGNPKRKLFFFFFVAVRKSFVCTSNTTCFPTKADIFSCLLTIPKEKKLLGSSFLISVTSKANEKTLIHDHTDAKVTF